VPFAAKDFVPFVAKGFVPFVAAEMNERRQHQ
jgi:hypothetical protein